MKPVIVRAALVATIVAMAGQPALAAEESVRGYDRATSILGKLIRRAEENIRKVDLIIEQQKAAERNTLRDAEARKLFEQGNTFLASGDLEGARKSWDEALRIAESPKMRNCIIEQQRKADKKATAERAEKAEAEQIAAETARKEVAALQERKRELFSQGKHLFDSGDLDGAEARFRELLVLDAAYPMAGEYSGDLIPARREELRLQAEREAMAQDAYERGNALLAKGNLADARSAWNEALRIADNREMRDEIAQKEASVALATAPDINSASKSVAPQSAAVPLPAVMLEAPAPPPAAAPVSAPVLPSPVLSVKEMVSVPVDVTKAVSGGRFVLEVGADGIPQGDGVAVVTGLGTRVYYISNAELVAGENITHVWEHDGKIAARLPLGLVGKTRRVVWSGKRMLVEWTGRWTVRTLTVDGRELSADSFNYVKE